MYQRIAKAMFFLAERTRGERVDLYLRELEGNQHAAVDKLRSICEAKLSRLLRHAAQRNPFYQNRFSGLDPVADFSAVPLLSKSDLRANYERIVTPGHERDVELCKTSGSTGAPLKFYRDRIVFGHTLASVYRAQRWYGLDIGSKHAMLWGIPAARGARARMRLRDVALNRFREREYDLSPAVLGDFFHKISRRKPEFVFGYSSMVYEFALFVSARRLDGLAFNLKAAVCTAETIHDQHRTLIESTFGCPVVSEYGSAETGIISYQCARGSHHISEDCVKLELLDERGHEVPDGHVGKVVVTVLHSQSAPLIRYELGDYAVRRPGLCECGVSLGMLDRVVGRTSGVIVTPNGKCFHSIAVYYIMKEFADKFGGVRQFRVIQTTVDQLEFHVAADREFAGAAQNWLAGAIHARFGQEMQVHFLHHANLERSAAGKLSDFESRIDADARLRSAFSSLELGTPGHA